MQREAAIWKMRRNGLRGEVRFGGEAVWKQLPRWERWGRWERGKTENHTAFSKTGTRKTCTVIVGILKEKNTGEHKGRSNQSSSRVLSLFNFHRRTSDLEMLPLQHVIAFIEPYL